MKKVKNSHPEDPKIYLENSCMATWTSALYLISIK